MSRWWAALLTVALLLTGGARPSRAEGTARSVARGDPACRRIALTFDAEIVPSRTRAILDVLSRYNARSTWFLTGYSARTYPAVAQAIAAAHEVGNHTNSHPYLTLLDPDDEAAEVQRGAQAIAAAIGAPPVPLFRPPFGNYDGQVLRILGSLGYPYSIMWSVDTRDWEGTPASVIAARILQGATPGSIVLMHGSAPHTAEGLEKAMAALWLQGYQFTTVGDLLGLLPDQRDLGGSRYVVQEGDTFTGIARCWRVTAAAILAANGVRPGTGVPPGTVVTIPYADQVTLRVAGQPVDLGSLILRANHDMVTAPLAPLAHALGARVTWDRPAGAVAIQLGWHMLHLRSDSTAAVASGRRLLLPLAPALQHGELWVPVRAVGEALGVAVGWDAEARTADLTPPSGEAGGGAGGLLARLI